MAVVRAPPYTYIAKEEEMTLRTIIYIRVSTALQANDGYSVAMQRRTLSDWCNDRDYKIVGIYADEGISGKDVNHRPEMLRAMEDIKADKADLIVVWALSRLTRSVADLYNIWQVCCMHNTDIVSITEPFDTSSPMGRAMMGILGVFAQMERELTAERVSAAMLERAVQGKRTSSGTLGYDLEGDSLKINPAEAEVVRYIFNKFIEHKSLSAVAELCSIKGYHGKRGQPFRAESIKTILTRRIYIGYNSYKGNLYKGDFPHLIEDKTFNKVQKILAAQARQYHKKL